MAFAVFESGGSQYNVAQGSKVVVKLVPGAIEGDELIFPTLMYGDGTDVDLSGTAKVKCKVLEFFKDKKVIVFKKKRRKGYKRKAGHRAQMLRLEVVEITK